MQPNSDESSSGPRPALSLEDLQMEINREI